METRGAPIRSSMISRHQSVFGTLIVTFLVTLLENLQVAIFSIGLTVSILRSPGWLRKNERVGVG